jgi:uncharacterized membrane protein
MMLLGLSLSWVVPMFSSEQPLSPAIVKATTVLATFALVITCEFLGRDPFKWLTAQTSNRGPLFLLVCAALPAVAAVGALELNASNNNSVALFAMASITATIIICCVIGLFRSRVNKQSTFLISLISSAGFALFLSTSLRGDGLFGSDIQKEFAVANETIVRGMFQIPVNGDAYASMASLTALPAYLHSLAGLSAMDFSRWFLPAILAIALAGAIAMIGDKYGDGPALVSFTILVIATASLARQFPALGRQELALAIFAAMLYFVSEAKETKRVRQFAIIFLAFGLAITHYTTAYVTVFFLIVALLVRYALRLNKEQRGNLVITWPLVLSVLVVVFLWNGVITRPATELVTDTGSTASSGLQILNNGANNPLRAWLVGTSISQVDAKTYEKALFVRRDATMPWLHYDHRADSLTLVDSHPEYMKVPLGQFNSIWTSGVILLRQVSNAMVVGLVAIFLLRRWRTKETHNLEIYTIAVGALLLVTVLRVSSTIALLYNPERGAIHAGFVFAFAFAAGIKYLLFRKSTVRQYLSRPRKHKLERRRSFNNRRRLLAAFIIAWASVNTLSSIGSENLIFNGGPLATFSNSGEDVERFKISNAELTTTSWLNANFNDRAVVYSDFYGTLALTANKTANSFRQINIIDPKAVDSRALVYATRANVVEGRARGKVSNFSATWLFTKDFYDNTRTIIYATEDTRVYGFTE